MLTDNAKAQDVLDQHHERNLEIMEEYDRFRVDFVKQRVAFHDKLVLLSAGTLALTVSAIAGFEQRHDLIYLGHLKLAWALLVASILLSLISSWVNIQYTYNSMRASLISYAEANNEYTHDALQVYAPNSGIPRPPSVVSEAERSQTHASYGQTFGLVTGLLARLAFFVA